MKMWVKPGRDEESEAELPEGQKNAALANALGGMIEFTRKQRSTSSPNPERRGCPSRKVLLAPIKSDELPGGELRSHMNGCSECFLAFRTALNEHKALALEPATPRRAWGNWLTLLKPGWALAGAVSLLIFLSAAGYVCRRCQQEAPLQGHADRGAPQSDGASAESPRGEEKASVVAAATSSAPAKAAEQRMRPARVKEAPSSRRRTIQVSDHGPTAEAKDKLNPLPARLAPDTYQHGLNRDYTVPCNDPTGAVMPRPATESHAGGRPCAPRLRLPSAESAGAESKLLQERRGLSRPSFGIRRPALEVPIRGLSREDLPLMRVPVKDERKTFPLPRVSQRPPTPRRGLKSLEGAGQKQQ